MNGGVPMATPATPTVMRAAWMGEAAHRAAIADITAALEAGPLHPVAAQRFSLDEIAASHEAMESGHTAGKLLIAISS